MRRGQRLAASGRAARGGAGRCAIGAATCRHMPSAASARSARPLASSRRTHVQALASCRLSRHCASRRRPSATAAAARRPRRRAAQERGGQEEFGPYEPVPNWPQPLPDGPDGVKHDGWTWGSVGAVYAETPDRIWIAQRGELPLPAGAKPWTPYAHAQPVARQRHRQRRRPRRHL